MFEERKSRNKEKVVDPQRAAAVAQLKNSLKTLASPKAGGISVVCHADPSGRLKLLFGAVRQGSQGLDIALANKVHALVVRIIMKMPSSKGAVLALDPKGVEVASHILMAVTEALARAVPTDSQKAPTVVENFVRRCMSTLCRFCETAESPAAWRFALRYIRDSAPAARVPIDTLLSAEALGQSYQSIESGFIAALTWFLERGDTAALTELATLFRRHDDFGDKARGHLSHLLSERASTLPSAAQQWIGNQLGIASPKGGLEYSDPVNSPDIREAASLLLYLFDQQMRNTELREAFERFRALSEAHFHLFLRGKVGEVTEFDSRLHESPEIIGSQGAELRLVRPWVEWFVPPDARIVIRGMLESDVHKAEAQ